MKKIQYFCDCCGREAADIKDLILVEISELRYGADRPEPLQFLKYDLCDDCHGKFIDAAGNYFAGFRTPRQEDRGYDENPVPTKKGVCGNSFHRRGKRGLI